MIRAHGGDVMTSSPVERLVVKNGEAQGVVVGGETITARAVLSGTHILETLDKLLPAEHRPAEADQMRVGNGFGAIVRLALDKPVEYAADPGLPSRTGLGLVCRDRQQILDAYADYLRGEPATDPPIVAMTFSAVDDTLAPPGGEVLWLWAQYFPYELARGQSWDDIGDQVAESILDTFETYAPGTKASVVGQLFQHPLWLERELGLFKGNVMHLEMTIDQMFSLRPSMGLSDYTGPVEGLFLTGASMHPGGGIMGAAGRNAARVVLKHLDRTP